MVLKIPRRVEINIDRLPSGKKRKRFSGGGAVFGSGVGKIVGQMENPPQHLGLQALGLGRIPPDLPECLFLIGIGDAQALGPPGYGGPGQQLRARSQKRNQSLVNLRQFLCEGKGRMLFRHVSRPKE